MSLPNPWPQQIEAAETVNDLLILLDRIEELDTTNQYEWILRRCRQYTQSKWLNFDGLRRMLEHYFIYDELDESDARQIYLGQLDRQRSNTK
jgi:hypothetical protein